MKDCGLGTKIRILIQSFWHDQVVVTNAGRYYGRPFRTGIVVTQWDPVSHTVFNIVVDILIMAVLLEVWGLQE